MWRIRLPLSPWTVYLSNLYLVLESCRIPGGMVMVFHLRWNPEEIGVYTAAAGESSLPARVPASKQNAKFLSSTFFYVSCHQKVWQRLRVDLSESKNRSRSFPHRNAQWCGFQWILNIKLTADLTSIHVFTIMMGGIFQKTAQMPRMVYHRENLLTPGQ